jgi:hypothetical protein
MDFADKLDMMDDDCDIEGFPLSPFNNVKLSKRLENEPKLFCRSEVIKFMELAVLAQSLQSKPMKAKDYDALIP